MLGFWRSCDADWRRWLVALVFAYEAPYMIAFSGGTYHFPVMPLVIPFAAVALAQGMDAWRRVATTRGVAIAFVIFALVQLQCAYAAIAFEA